MTIDTLPEGKSFKEENPGIVMDHLRNVEREKLVVSSDNLLIRENGAGLSLRIMGERSGDYPVRKSFLMKLLKWYSFPKRQLNKLSLESIQSILNDYLLNIKRKQVVVKLEDGEAVTITSTSYSEISDLEVLELCSSKGIEFVSRTDFMMRIYFRLPAKIEPVPGDIFSVGLNLFNSETGFKALTATDYLFREICRNGTLITKDENTESLIHYRKSKEELTGFLSEKMLHAYRRSNHFLLIIRKSINTSAGEMEKETKNMLRGTLPLKTVNHLTAASEGTSFYDVYNKITRYARDLNMEKKASIERIAGRLLMSNYSRGEKNNIT